ncbi:winged helix-turn-helix transcriptional regulator [Micromonospora sp. STR1s_5]|nr:winged helix-turn-helix transcriptional regulator [Micromonospora sp. STR1s_5]
MKPTSSADVGVLTAIVDAIQQVQVERPMPASHIQALLLVASREDKGITTQELVDALHMDQSGVKRILDGLSRYGRSNTGDGLDWVYSIDDPQSRARKLFLLTAKGRNKVQNMVRCFNIPHHGSK